jgi:hypothetical protein
MRVNTAFRFLRELTDELASPDDFFTRKKNESWRNGFIFFLSITSILSIATPVMNYLGFQSNDFSSAYQAQITAYNFAKANLIEVYGTYAYFVEAALIMILSLPILVSLTVLLHVVYRLIGGQGSILNAWKAACYGVGPCLLGGFLPYVSLFAGFYSFAMQFYLGPMTLYNAKQSRAIVIFVAFITLAFIEMLVLGTTVGTE